jgi:hypothetical protein
VEGHRSHRAGRRLAGERDASACGWRATRDAAEAARLPSRDYWLFDSRLLVKMHFADDDRFAYAEVIEDPALIVEHNYWRDAARHHALTPEDFITKHGQRDD